MDAPTSPKDMTKVDNYGVPKKLHYVVIANMIPALALGIAHGAVTSHVAPAIGLLPAGLGAILAVYRSGLFRKVKKSSEHEYQILLSNDGEERRKRTYFVQSIFFAIADFLIMSGLIISIVFAWLGDYLRCYYSTWHYDGARHRYRSCHSTGLPMLAAYATFPLLIAT
jgi:hypothetical protein